MINKKAVSPIIAIVLIIIITIVAGVSLLDFGKDFQEDSFKQTDNLITGFDKKISIEKVVQEKIIIRNKLKININITTLEINGEKCINLNGNEELIPGFNTILISDLYCSGELKTTGKKNLFIKIEDLVLSKKFNLKKNNPPFNILDTLTGTIAYIPGVGDVILYYSSTSDVIIDTTNNLMWEKTKSFSNRNWEAATSSCTGLVKGGDSDWRLPTRTEFFSSIVVPYGQPNQGVVGGLSYGTYYLWTSDKYSSTAFFVSLGNGDSARIGLSSTIEGLCVRNFSI